MADATIMTIDFSKADSIRLHKSGKIRDRGHANDTRPMTADGKLLTPKQIRARQRRAAKRKRQPRMSEQEFEALYKPIEDWDLDELAHGRPRNSEGNFKGRKPTWITREVHERAMELFKTAIKTEMGTLTPTAIDTIRFIMEDNREDERGKPLTPAAAKLQASTFLLEHAVGKPKQEVTQDISVKLQGILGAVMVNPNTALASPEQGGNAYQLAHFPGHTIPIGADKDDTDIVEGDWVDEDEDLNESDG